MMPGVGPSSFGLGPVGLNLAKEQNDLGVEAAIWCLDDESDILWACESSGLSTSRVRGFAHTGPRTLGLSFAMERAFKNEQDTCDIIHQHGIWTGLSRVSNIARSRHHTPVVVAPHGSLEAWAKRKSWWKKKLALSFYERRNLKSASCLHACSYQEAAGFREHGLCNPVAVIPNGVGSSWLKSDGYGVRFRRIHSIPESKRIILYLSRITPIKGLPMLMEAFGEIRHQLADWVLVIAGADEFKHLQVVRKAVCDFGLQKTVIFTGLLKDQLKRDAFSAADIFILPTLRENFAIVVTEALGAGVPVITTKGAPWQDLIMHDCGWWTDISAEALAVALREGIAKTQEELKAMGERGRALVRKKYTWTQSAQMTIELYEWLQGSQKRPDFVVMD